MITPIISRRRRLFEVAAVLITALGKFVFMDWFAWKLPFIIIAIVGWTIYVIRRARYVEGILQYWGFNKETFMPVLRMVLPFAIASIIVLFCIGFYRETIRLTWHIIPILILYPIWGTIQQFLVIGLVAGNLNELNRARSSAPVIFVSALLFGLLHYPNYWLILGTFVLALFYGYIYLKARNVYVMGILHGWLGAIFFYTVVDRDPFAEVFGWIVGK